MERANLSRHDVYADSWVVSRGDDVVGEVRKVRFEPWGTDRFRPFLVFVGEEQIHEVPLERRFPTMTEAKKFARENL